MKNLTNKSKSLIIISIVIAILLIITIAILYLQMSENNTINRRSIVLIPTIVILALISVFVVVYNRQKRNQYTKDLNTEYFEVFETIQDSIKNSNLTKTERQEVLSDVTSMLYHAQIEKRNIKDVVGNDIDEFTKKVKESFGYRNSLLFYILNGALYLIMILSLLQGINFLIHEEVTLFFNAKMGTSIIPYMVMLSFLIVPLTRYSMSKQKIGWTFLVPIIFIVLYITIHEILDNLNLNINWINNYLNGEVVFIKSYWLLLLYVSIVGIFLFTKWCLRKRSLQKL